MKIILLFNFVLFSLIGCGESKTQQQANTQIEKIAGDTLKLVRQINEYILLADSTKIELKSLQRDIYESAEGGTVTLFYNKADTLKKEIVYYGETGKRTVQIYQKQGKPILVEDTEIRYKEPINVGKDIEIKDSVANIYYLDDKQNLIYWLKDGKIMPQSQYKTREQEIIKD